MCLPAKPTCPVLPRHKWEGPTVQRGGVQWRGDHPWDVGERERESVYTSPFFNKQRFQALSSPPIAEINVSDGRHQARSSAPEIHVYIPMMICDNCSKPHKTQKATIVLTDVLWPFLNYVFLFPLWKCTAKLAGQIELAFSGPSKGGIVRKLRHDLTSMADFTGQ